LEDLHFSDLLGNMMLVKMQLSGSFFLGEMDTGPKSAHLIQINFQLSRGGELLMMNGRDDFEICGFIEVNM